MKKKPGSSATAHTDKTDWVRLRALPDAGVVFTPDAPATAPDDWTDALAHHGLPLPVRKQRPDADMATASA